MPARATEAYAEAWSVILQRCWGQKPARARDRDEPLPHLTQLLPFLRQLLTCCACAGLLEDAMVSISCGHCYCCKCQVGAPLLKIQCRQCRERRGLVIETQLRLVVKCYRRMCHVLADYLSRAGGAAAAAVKGGEFTLAKGREIPEGFDPISELLTEVLEGKIVSQLVLFVLPPAKYINPKPPPDPPASKTSPVRRSQELLTDEPPGSDVELSEGGSCPEEEEGELGGQKSLSSSTPVVAKGKRERSKRANQQLQTPQLTPPTEARENILSADFHGDVEFSTARPLSRRGQTCLCVHRELLELKAALIFEPWPAAESHLAVDTECLEVAHVLPETSDLSLFPASSACVFHSSGEGWVDGSSRGLHCSLFPAPRPGVRRVRPVYKSPYLTAPVNEKKGKAPAPNTPNPLSTSHLKLPRIKLTLSSGTSDPPATATTPTLAKKKKRSPTTPGHWRCRCGTNNPQTFDRICARGKCPCFFKNIPCINCLCRHCKNPYNISP